MENVQTLLTVVVIALTVLLIVIGVQVALMIIDLRRAVKRLNTILDDTISEGLIRPDKVAGIIEFFRKKIKSHGQGQEPLN